MNQMNAINIDDVIASGEMMLASVDENDTDDVRRNRPGSTVTKRIPIPQMIEFCLHEIINFGSKFQRCTELLSGLIENFNQENIFMNQSGFEVFSGLVSHLITQIDEILNRHQKRILYGKLDLLNSINHIRIPQEISKNKLSLLSKDIREYRSNKIQLNDCRTSNAPYVDLDNLGSFTSLFKIVVQLSRNNNTVQQRIVQVKLFEKIFFLYRQSFPLLSIYLNKTEISSEDDEKRKDALNLLDFHAVLTSSVSAIVSGQQKLSMKLIDDNMYRISLEGLSLMVSPPSEIDDQLKIKYDRCYSKIIFTIDSLYRAHNRRYLNVLHGGLDDLYRLFRQQIIIDSPSIQSPSLLVDFLYRLLTDETHQPAPKKILNLTTLPEEYRGKFNEDELEKIDFIEKTLLG
ncbi:hypothetical protein SNEBB_010774 [Seison nebaliae]|nr:hypothetical protein SNEBB_010774 [Seison nebaliae]